MRSFYLQECVYLDSKKLMGLVLGDLSKMRLRVLCVLRPSKRRDRLFPKLDLWVCAKFCKVSKAADPSPPPLCSNTELYPALLSSKFFLNVGAMSQPLDGIFHSFTVRQPQTNYFDIPSSIAVNWPPSFSDAPNEGRERGKKGAPSSSALFVFCQLQLL